MGMCQNQTTGGPHILVYVSIQGYPFWVHIFNPQPFGLHALCVCIVSQSDLVVSQSDLVEMDLKHNQHNCVCVCARKQVHAYYVGVYLLIATWLGLFPQGLAVTFCATDADYQAGGNRSQLVTRPQVLVLSMWLWVSKPFWDPILVGR